jgi:hypothetical protein
MRFTVMPVQTGGIVRQLSTRYNIVRIRQGENHREIIECTVFTTFDIDEAEKLCKRYNDGVFD